jgi:hypothetical protein
VLYEGYLLYPYRASALKNQLPWQFGIVAPRNPDGADPEPWFSQTDCYVEAAPDARLQLRLRCLTVGSQAEKGVRQSIDVGPFELGDTARHDVGLDVPGIAARLLIDVTPADRVNKLRIRLENLELWQPQFGTDRGALLQHSLVSAHLLLAVEGTSFVSLLEPPAEHAAVVETCVNEHTWPVLVGERGQQNLMLSSPIVLYDYPQIAPESPGDLCDATEIDEILSLRILTMTDEEKRQARATDPMASAILDRTEAMQPDTLAALHGTMRSVDFFNPVGDSTPETASVNVQGGAVAKGSHVVLRPNRRADAMDMFLSGQPATVSGVYRDVDDRVYVAVTVDADPAAQLHGEFGRFFYFNPDEIEVMNP